MLCHRDDWLCCTFSGIEETDTAEDMSAIVRLFSSVQLVWLGSKRSSLTDTQYWMLCAQLSSLKTMCCASGC
jgi:uncharacterized membrane protein YjdF